MSRGLTLVACSLGVVGCGGRSRSLAPSADVSAPAPDATWTTLSYTSDPAPRDNVTWVAPPATFTDVWSDSSERVWVVASQENYKGPTTSAVKRWEAGSFQAEGTGFLYTASLSGLDASDLWLAADTGIEHRDGASWTSLSSGLGDLISEAGPTDVWSCCPALGSTPGAYQAAHWDGEQWTLFSLPVLDGFAPTAIFARPSADVWITGAGGYLLHGDGRAWQTLQDPTVGRWNSVWGDAQRKSVWTVGTHGAIARWDSASAEQRLPTEAVFTGDVDLADVWGSGPDAIWVVGSAGTILSVKGSRLELEPSGTTVPLRALWGVASGAIWVAGSNETLLVGEF